MKAVFEGATIKVWFLNAGISRNFIGYAKKELEEFEKEMLEMMEV